MTNNEDSRYYLLEFYCLDLLGRLHLTLGATRTWMPRRKASESGHQRLLEHSVNMKAEDLVSKGLDVLEVAFQECDRATYDGFDAPVEMRSEFPELPTTN